MKRISTLLLLLIAISAPQTMAQFSIGKALSAGYKVIQAYSITDEQMAQYARQSVDYMDSSNKVASEGSPYTQRLRRLTRGITDADGIPLNFKVYETSDVNAFACPDGSVRVFTGIMDLMTDDELLGIIGHEIGHVIKRHSKNAFKNQLKTSALLDAVSSTGGRLASLTDSQLGTLGEAFISARYSKKQENEADNCGYDFLVSNGKNPWGMVMAFEKLLQLEANSSSKVAGYFAKMFSSHPDTKSRILAMTSRCNADGFTRPRQTASTVSSSAQVSSSAKTDATRKAVSTSRKRATTTARKSR